MPNERRAMQIKWKNVESMYNNTTAITDAETHQSQLEVFLGSRRANAPTAGRENLADLLAEQDVSPAQKFVQRLRIVKVDVAECWVAQTLPQQLMSSPRAA